MTTPPALPTSPGPANWLDRAVNYVSPTHGLRRITARLRYEAAKNTRFRDPTPPVSGSESSQSGYDRSTLISLSRDLEQNFALYRHLLDKFSMFTIPRLTYQAKTGDAETNRAIEAYWGEWCSRADLAGVHDLTMLARLALRSRKRDGDVLVIFRQTADGLRLQMIEADRVGEPYMVGSSEEYVAGVTRDPATGRPQFYRVYYRTRGDAYIDPVDIPADQALLLFQPTRLDQVRGVTDFSSLINVARDYKETMEALRQGIKFECLHAGVVTANNPEVDAMQAWADGMKTKVAGVLQPLSVLEPGKIQYVNPGESVNFLQNSRPSTAFQGYMETLVAEMAAGANLPAGFLHSMLTGKGPGVRMEAQLAHRTFALEQQLMVSQFLGPVRDRVLLDAMLSGLIPTTPHWRLGKFTFGPWVTIDSGRDTRAMLDEYRAGVRTLSSIAEEQGDDWEDIIRQTAIEKRRMAEISLEEGVEMLDQRLLTPSGQIPTEIVEQSSGQRDPAAADIL